MGVPVTAQRWSVKGRGRVGRWKKKDSGRIKSKKGSEEEEEGGGGGGRRRREIWSQRRACKNHVCTYATYPYRT